MSNEPKIAHFYDTDDWECTFDWEDRDAHAPDFDIDTGSVKRFGTLLKGPDRFLANVPLKLDDEGYPDECELRWFDTEDEARAAIKAATQAHGATTP